MKSVCLRVAAVTSVHVVLSEGLNRLAVHWRESSGELAGMLLFVLLLAGLIWAVSGVLRGHRSAALRVVCRTSLVVGLFAATYTFDYFYYWHVRPNLGWYEENDWVAQHPHFQRQLRARIEANMWHSNAAADEAPE